MRIRVPAGYSLSNVVESHGWSQLLPFECDASKKLLRYVDDLGDGRVLAYEVSQPGRDVVVQFSDESADVGAGRIRRRLEEMLQVRLDLSPFYGAASDEPKLASAIAQRRGRMLRGTSVFEDIVKTILTTNTTWSGTIRMNARLVETWGASLPGDPSRRAFPSPVALAAVPEEDLRKVAGLGYRAAYVSALARAQSAGEIDVESFRTDPAETQELRKKLLSIDGVGPYASASLLVLLDRFDFLPIDSWALKLVSCEWYNGAPVTRTQVEEAFEVWGPWKALAYWFWDWRYMQNADAGKD